MTDYTKMKNSELETLLKQRNLPHNGKKAEMVARLLEADNTGPADKPATEAKPAETPAPAKAPESEPAKETASAAAPAPASKPSEDKPTPAPATSEAKPETNGTTQNGEAAKPAQTDFSKGLAESSVDEELARRKKRAEKFGVVEPDPPKVDAEEEKRKKRMERFMTKEEREKAAAGEADSEEQQAKLKLRAERFNIKTETEAPKTAVDRLNAALPEKVSRKRGRAPETEPAASMDDPALKRRRGRGGFRGRGRGRGGRAANKGGR